MKSFPEGTLIAGEVSILPFRLTLLVICLVRRPHGADLNADCALRTQIIVNSYHIVNHADCYSRAQINAAPASHTLARVYGYHGNAPFCDELSLRKPIHDLLTSHTRDPAPHRLPMCYPGTANSLSKKGKRLYPARRGYKSFDINPILCYTFLSMEMRDAVQGKLRGKQYYSCG